MIPQEPAICLYYEPVESNQHRTPLHPNLLSGLFDLGLPTKTLYVFYMHCLLLIIKFFAMIICIEQYKSRSSSWYIFPPPSCYLLPLVSKYYPRRLVLKNPQVSQPRPVTALRFVLSWIQLFALRPTVLLLLSRCAMAVP